MLRQFTLTTEKEGFYNITPQVLEAILQSGVTEGIALVHCPHTTAGITVNENSDPDVTRDLLFALNETYPHREEFMHYEGNSAAHLKALACGTQTSVIIHDGRALLGIWQGVYFCEFDGPRTRRFFVKVMEG